MTLDRYSWGHRTDAKLEDYLGAKELIAELVVTVSCGGNLLVNVGPNKAGTIEPIFVERLTQMGTWLQTNGEAIYDSQPWNYQNDTRTSSVWYTWKPDEDGGGVYSVYAIVLEYPFETRAVELAAISALYPRIARVSLLGYPDKLEVVPIAI